MPFFGSFATFANPVMADFGVAATMRFPTSAHTSRLFHRLSIAIHVVPLLTVLPQYLYMISVGLTNT